MVYCMANIILITSDSLRADELYGCMNCKNLRRLMKDSIVFKKHVSIAPYTSLSLYSIMASKIPSCFSKHNEGCRIPKYVPIQPQILMERDYITFGFQDSNPFLTSRYGYGRGFNVFVDYIGYENRSLVNPDPLNRVIDRVVGNNKISHLIKYYILSVPRPIQGALNIVYDIGKIIDKLCMINRGFYIWIHLMDTHGPHTGKGYVNKTRLSYAIHRIMSRGKGICSCPKDLELLKNLYREDIEVVDQAVGLLVEKLKDAQCYSNTAIMFTADHGEEFCDHGVYGHHARLYDELIRVPLILKLPGEVYRGEVYRGVSSHLDILPTILEITGVDSMYGLMGRSLIKRFERKHNDYVVSIAYSDKYHVVSSRDDRFKLIAYFKPSSMKPYRVEAYDLLSDPHEHLNILESIEEDLKGKMLRKILLIRRMILLRKKLFRRR